MFISPRGAESPTCQVYHIGAALTTVKSATYLGLQIDENLQWSSRLSMLSKRINQLAGALWRNGNGLTLSARRSWLTGIARSYLTYASNAFFPSLTVGELVRLTKLFKQCVRSVFRVHPPVSSVPLLSALDLPALEKTLRDKVAVFVFRCLSGKCSALFNSYFEPLSSTVNHSDRRITRGTRSNLLVIPFLPGSSGRRTLQFFGSVLWNDLPARVRSIDVRNEFVASL